MSSILYFFDGKKYLACQAYFKLELQIIHKLPSGFKLKLKNILL